MTVVDAKCEVPGLNKYGEVSNGFMVLRGPVLTMLVNCVDPYNWWTYTVGDDADSRELMSPDYVLVAFEFKGRVNIKRARRGDTPERFSVDVTCIRIGNEISPYGTFMYGLLLCQ